MIAIFYALEAEIKDLKKGGEIDCLAEHGDCRVEQARLGGVDVLLVATGVGNERARAAAGFALATYPVTHVISSGFAGALNERSKAGDVFIASSLDVEGGGPQDGPLPADAGLVRTAESLKAGGAIPLMTGRGVTISAVCATPEAKLRLGARFRADFVDMESYWLGRAAAARRLPFLTVRAVSDSVQDDLAFIGQVSVDGRLAPGKIVRHFLAHPGNLPRSFALSGQIARAGRNLAGCLAALIAEIGREDEHFGR